MTQRGINCGFHWHLHSNTPVVIVQDNLVARQYQQGIVTKFRTQELQEACHYPRTMYFVLLLHDQATNKVRPANPIKCLLGCAKEACREYCPPINLTNIDLSIFPSRNRMGSLKRQTIEWRVIVRVSVQARQQDVDFANACLTFCDLGISGFASIDDDKYFFFRYYFYNLYEPLVSKFSRDLRYMHIYQISF